MNTKMTAKVMDNNALNRAVAERLGCKLVGLFSDEDLWIEHVGKEPNELTSYSALPDYAGYWPAAMELRDRVSRMGDETIIAFIAALYDETCERHHNASWSGLLMTFTPSDICRAFLSATEVSK